MPGHLRLVPIDRPARDARVVDPFAPVVRIVRGDAVRDQLGGALRRLYRMDPEEAMPAEFDALLRAIEDPAEPAQA